MKRFMYLSISILCLSIAALIGFYIGSESAQAQVGDVVAGYRVDNYNGLFRHFVMLSNGDVYMQKHDLSDSAFERPGTQFIGNFWGTTVPTSSNTWGGVKRKYEGKK